MTVIGVEPETAACLTAALQAGEPVEIPTPGTTMAGLDCAIVSDGRLVRRCCPASAARSPSPTSRPTRRWPNWPTPACAIGESGAAPLAALPALEPSTPGPASLLIATEGPTDPAGYREIVA